MIDAERELKLLENSLRDFIEFVLSKKYGPNWIGEMKIPSSRVASWKARKDVEAKRLTGEALEDRLLYYANLYDIQTIISKNWDHFHAALGKKKEIEVLLSEVEKLRDPNAHRRELKKYQRYLIAGISGEIRTRIMKYRGKKEDADDYFPVIEAVADSLGNNASNTSYAQHIVSKVSVRVGDEVEIKVFSTDPLGGELEYSISRIGAKRWNESNNRTIVFSEEDIGRCCDINVMVRSKRSYYAYSDFDDYVMYRYEVLPAAA